MPPDQLVPQDQLVPLVLQALIQLYLDLPVLLEHKVHKEYKELLGQQDLRVLLVPQVPLEIPVLRALQGLQEPILQFLDQRDQPDQQALQEPQEPLERLELLDLRVYKA